MDLAQELRGQISAYLSGAKALADLRDWLAAHVQAIYDIEDQDARELSDRAWILVSELDCGHRDEDSGRQALGDLCRSWPLSA